MTKAERKQIVATVKTRMENDLSPEPDPNDKMNRGKYQRAAWAVRLGPDVEILYIDGKKLKEYDLCKLAKALRDNDAVEFVKRLNDLEVADAMRDRVLLHAGFALPDVQVALAGLDVPFAADFKYLVTNLIDSGQCKSRTDLKAAMDQLMGTALHFKTLL